MKRKSPHERDVCVVMVATGQDVVLMVGVEVQVDLVLLNEHF